MTGDAEREGGGLVPRARAPTARGSAANVASARTIPRALSARTCTRAWHSTRAWRRGPLTPGRRRGRLRMTGGRCGPSGAVVRPLPPPPTLPQWQGTAGGALAGGRGPQGCGARHTKNRHRMTSATLYRRVFGRVFSRLCPPVLTNIRAIGTTVESTCVDRPSAYSFHSSGDVIQASTSRCGDHCPAAHTRGGERGPVADSAATIASATCGSTPYPPLRSAGRRVAMVSWGMRASRPDDDSHRRQSVAVSASDVDRRRYEAVAMATACGRAVENK